MNKRKVAGWISVFVALGAASSIAFSQNDANEDPFDGRLFPPNVILDRQAELELTDSQRQQIREIVLATQATVAERQWDMRDAYQALLAELDKPIIDEPAVMESLQSVLETENSVKLEQISMLIRLRNLLTAEQAALLRSGTQ